MFTPTTRPSATDSTYSVSPIEDSGLNHPLRPLEESHELFQALVDQMRDQIGNPLNGLDGNIAFLKQIVALSPDGLNAQQLQDINKIIEDLETCTDAQRKVLDQEFVRSPSLKVYRRGSTQTTIVTKRILVVEDSKTNQTILRRMLENAGHTVVIAADGLIAISLWTQALSSQDTAPFDLIFMDLNMPVLGGKSAIEQIRRIECNVTPPIHKTPIIVLTTNRSEQHEQETLALGADCYMEKPYNRTKICNAIVQYTRSKDRTLIFNSVDALAGQPENAQPSDRDCHNSTPVARRWSLKD